MDIEELIRAVIQCIYNVRGVLAPGFMENVYQNALLIELKENGLKACQEVPVNVYYKGVPVGEYRADIIVDDRLILELKSIQKLLPAHEAQLVNYLTATKFDHGLLINFGSEHIEIKRKFRTYKKAKA